MESWTMGFSKNLIMFKNENGILDAEVHKNLIMHEKDGDKFIQNKLTHEDVGEIFFVAAIMKVINN